MCTGILKTHSLGAFGLERHTHVRKMKLCGEAADETLDSLSVTRNNGEIHSKLDKARVLCEAL